MIVHPGRAVISPELVREHQGLRPMTLRTEFQGLIKQG